MFGPAAGSAPVTGRCLAARSWSPHRILALLSALLDCAKSGGLLGEPIYSIALLMLLPVATATLPSTLCGGWAMNYWIAAVGATTRFTVWNCGVPNIH
jgi:hypothetical protein